MDLEEMELSELKDYARSLGVTVGNIGKAKLIAKIQAKQEEDAAIADVIEDEDIDDVPEDEVEEEEEYGEEEDDVVPQDTASLLDSISDVIDDLDDSATEQVEIAESLPLDTVIPVKSITYGTLIYKARSTNAVFRWSKIGAIEYMTIAELNEMNSYKEDFLKKPLVILMDEKAVKQFRLTPVYENVAKINNLTKVFASKDMRKIEQTIDTALDVNMRDIMISKVRQMYQNKKLTDINIIRLLEDKLKFDLSDSE